MVVMSRPGKVVKKPVAPIPIPSSTTDHADRRCSRMISSMYITRKVRKPGISRTAWATPI